ncbi:hypothetical protein [Hyalangium sp.]|uniref:hypothetical protein n=1 Tax=Hyalangium sp. TaxID=2028555 RepID=UPI002D5D7B6C|nr:hypothetical protein [Hyalangium sp.]HYI03218.1 hypothetical protein [Hyalangium sp.]
MSERLRAPPAHPSAPERELSPEGLRRLLEGRLEVIEAARKRYAALEKRLRGVLWRRRLRAHDGLQEVLDQEGPLDEALGRARKRMELEGWPETLPVFEPLRDVLRHRARVGALVRKRLAELAVPLGTANLGEELALLRSVVREPPSLVPAREETRILEMKRNASIPPPVAILLLLIGPILSLVPTFAGPALFLFVAGILVTLVGLYVARAGEFWLTSDRLIWKPVVGDPVAVSLRSIRPGGIQLERLSRSVHVQGDRIVHVRYAEPVERLAALLEMHRQPPFLGASRGGLRVSQVSLYEATLRSGPGTRPRQGMVALRPEGVSFVPVGTGREALKALTGEPPSEGLSLEVSWVLEELRWLSESEFDEHLARVVAATGGVHWSAWEVRRAREVPVWKEIHITCGPQSLVGKVDWSQQAAAERVFESWPSPEP